MKIKSISLAWVSTAHIAQAKQFFHETLGLAITNNHEDMGWLEFGPQGDKGMLLGVGRATEACTHRPGDNAVVTFTVDAIEEAKKELEAKGVTFEGEIQEVPGHVKLVSFFDKDHNRFQLVEQIGEF